MIKIGSMIRRKNSPDLVFEVKRHEANGSLKCEVSGIDPGGSMILKEDEVEVVHSPERVHTLKLLTIALGHDFGGHFDMTPEQDASLLSPEELDTLIEEMTIYRKFVVAGVKAVLKEDGIEVTEDRATHKLKFSKDGKYVQLEWSGGGDYPRLADYVKLFKLKEGLK